MNKRKTRSFKHYKRETVRMLEKDFEIELTNNQLEHIVNCTNEIQVDNYAKTLISKHLSQ